MEGQTVEHDITPLSWSYTSGEDTIQTFAMASGQSAVLTKYAIVEYA